MISRHDTPTSTLLSGADGKLTPKQQRFIQEYTVDLNGTQAAIRAGYSPKTARSIASENLQRPAVKTAVQKALREGEERPRELTAVAFADPWDAVKWDPEDGFVLLKPNSNIIQSVRRVMRTDPKTGRRRRIIVSIKFRDRTRAILELGRRLGAL
jgi:phage terminase small subunit